MDDVQQLCQMIKIAGGLGSLVQLLGGAASRGVSVASRAPGAMSQYGQAGLRAAQSAGQSGLNVARATGQSGLNVARATGTVATRELRNMAGLKPGVTFGDRPIRSVANFTTTLPFANKPLNPGNALIDSVKSKANIAAKTVGYGGAAVAAGTAGYNVVKRPEIVGNAVNDRLVGTGPVSPLVQADARQAGDAVARIVSRGRAAATPAWIGGTPSQGPLTSAIGGTAKSLGQHNAATAVANQFRVNDNTPLYKKPLNATPLRLAGSQVLGTAPKDFSAIPTLAGHLFSQVPNSHAYQWLADPSSHDAARAAFHAGRATLRKNTRRDPASTESPPLVPR